MRTTVELVYTTHPYEHQREALERAWGCSEFAFFLEQGTGKSKIIVDEITNLIERDLINCAVILAPNQVHENWQEQFELHGPPNYQRWQIQVYKSRNDEARQEQHTRDIIASGKVLVFLMNIEALSSKKGQSYLYRLLRARSKIYFAIDESHKIKSWSAIRTKYAISYGQYAKFRRIATGTEAQEGLENLYAQFKFLNWVIIGHRGVTSFKGMYCRMGGFENRKIIGYQNQAMLAAKIAPYAYQKRKHECLDLPDKVYVQHHVEMTREQETIYNILEEEMLYEIEKGVLVDTTMALTKLMRLQQVLCGHLSAEDVKKDIPSNRAALVSELAESTSGKVIVFCRFIRDVWLVVEELTRNGMQSVGITGAIENRLEQINSWRGDPNIKALVITVQTGGTGLTLNEANTTIFYSNGWSSTDRLQAEDRNHRIGQTNKVTYHDIITRGKIDSRILRALNSKESLADQFRELLTIGKAKTIHDWLYEDAGE
jgi:SNF2 family DNA or RNA helicase